MSADQIPGETLDQMRARRTAEAIASIGKRPVRLARMERLSEHQAEERHRMVQAQRLK